jgi:hypothetical protein
MYLQKVKAKKQYPDPLVRDTDPDPYQNVMYPKHW